MQESSSSQQTAEESGLSLRDVFVYLSAVGRYLRSKWYIILGFGILCGLLGVAYSMYKKPSYTAVSTFVLEEGSGGRGLGQYAGLASLAGIDISSGGAGGIFQGDNILELYKSRLMIEKTLLNPVTVDNKQQLLIDRYIEFNGLNKKWKEAGLGDVKFGTDPTKFNRTQDSIITKIAELFNKQLLSVNKLDKKLSIIRVEVNSTDEVFAKLFNEHLVETVNNFYTVTKTKKSSQNIQVLQRQADSVKRVLGASLSGVAAAIDAAPNANPALISLKVPSQKRQIDVQATSAIYSEIVKNLELSKIGLRQETPLIQVIDEPVYPLPKSKLGVVKGLVIGFVLGAFIITLWLVFKRALKEIMS